MVFIKRSYILKQTYSFQLQVCLSMFDLLLDTGRIRDKNSTFVDETYMSGSFNRWFNFKESSIRTIHEPFGKHLKKKYFEKYKWTHSAFTTFIKIFGKDKLVGLYSDPTDFY